MTGHRHVTIAAAGATFLAAAPLAAVFRTYSWALYALGVVGVVLAAALLTRGLRLPVWAQILSMLGAHTVLLGWLFGGGTMALGVLPTPDTTRRFWHLLQEAATDVRELAAPVPDTDGLMFTVAASVGLVAILVDVLAVTLRQPALSGLPMLAIYSVPVAVLAGSVSWISFGFAAAGFLWLLVADHVGRVRGFGRRFADDGRDVDAWESSPLAATGRRLGLVGITAAVLIPLALPATTAGFLDSLIAGAGFSGGPGINSRVIDPMAMLTGSLNREEDTTLLVVSTRDPDPGFLRLAVADEITDQGASPTSLRSDRRVLRGLLEMPGVGPGDGVEGTEYTARITVAGLQQGYLPTYHNTGRVRVNDDNRWFHDDRKSVIWSGGATEQGLTYDVSYLKLNLTEERLRAAAPSDSGDPAISDFTAVPDNSTVRRLVDRLTDKTDRQYDQVMSIYNHFSEKSGFTYSLEVDEGTSGSAIVDFLDNKKGFCQQYAVAMAWMVRTAGIPARVAIGFTKGRVVNEGYEIRSWNAHAWVEVYFQDIGWVPFDPTPSGNVYNAVNLPWAPNPFRPPASTPSATASPDASATTSPSPTRTDNRDPGEDAQAAAGGTSDPPARWPYWLFSGLLVVALLAAPGLRRSLVRRRRLGLHAGSGADPAAAAYAAWDELLDTMVDLDIGYQPSETPRAVARRLRDVRPPLIESSVAEIGLLARAVERARYAPEPLPGADLGQAVRTVRAELWSTATRWQRFRGTVLPGSVIRDWRRFLDSTRDQTLDAWQRWREEATEARQERAARERMTFH
jgi:transglutaminase-like putative cysteine protease